MPARWKAHRSLGAAPLDSPPRAVSWGPGHLDVFWCGRAADGALWHRWYEGGATNQWFGPESLGAAPLGSSPQPVSWGPGHVEVFWRGADGALWHRWYEGGATNQWFGPESLGAAPLGSSPQPVSWGPGHIDVFWHGMDQALWRKSYVEEDPTRDGEWSVGSSTTEILAIHAAVLHNGEVLCFGGSQYSPTLPPPSTDATRQLNPTSGTVRYVASPADHDIFCSGHAFLADGRLLVAGGFEAASGSHSQVGHTTGLRETSIYTPAPAGAGSWQAAARLLPEPDRAAGTFKPTGGGRWYPTLLTLADGRVLAMLGHPSESDSRHANTTLEIFNHATATWLDQGPQADVPMPVSEYFPFYPRLHLLPDGQVFCASPLKGRSTDPEWACWKWSPSTKSWSIVAPSPGDDYLLKNNTELPSSVLLPLRPEDGYRARVLFVGEAGPRLIDLGAPSPAWKPTAPRALAGSPRRTSCTAVLLPNGMVLVVGGSAAADAWTAVLEAELYDPLRDQWSVGAAADVPRQYHAVALLLPDGRVWTAGSNAEHRPENRELRVEYYSPPYLFRGARPAITTAPSEITPGGPDFTIETPAAATVTSVVLSRCGSVTHGFDADQRVVFLTIRSRASGSVTVAPPPNANVAPPGHYLLFLVDSNGAPSLGRFAHLG